MWDLVASILANVLEPPQDPPLWSASKPDQKLTYSNHVGITPGHCIVSKRFFQGGRAENVSFYSAWMNQGVSVVLQLVFPRQNGNQAMKRPPPSTSPPLIYYFKSAAPEVSHGPTHVPHQAVPHSASNTNSTNKHTPPPSTT